MICYAFTFDELRESDCLLGRTNRPVRVSRRIVINPSHFPRFLRLITRHYTGT
jgi:hypothetical protein